VSIYFLVFTSKYKTSIKKKKDKIEFGMYKMADGWFEIEFGKMNNFFINILYLQGNKIDYGSNTIFIILLRFLLTALPTNISGDILLNSAGQTSKSPFLKLKSFPLVMLPSLSSLQMVK